MINIEVELATSSTTGEKNNQGPENENVERSFVPPSPPDEDIPEETDKFEEKIMNKSGNDTVEDATNDADAAKNSFIEPGKIFLHVS